jgi:hypothetical protein
LKIRPEHHEYDENPSPESLDQRFQSWLCLTTAICSWISIALAQAFGLEWQTLLQLFGYVTAVLALLIAAKLKWMSKPLELSGFNWPAFLGAGMAYFVLLFRFRQIGDFWIPDLAVSRLFFAGVIIGIVFAFASGPPVLRTVLTVGIGLVLLFAPFAVWLDQAQRRARIHRASDNIRQMSTAFDWDYFSRPSRKGEFSDGDLPTVK